MNMNPKAISSVFDRPVDKRCVDCEDHVFQFGLCKGLNDPLHPCTHVPEEGRGTLNWIEKRDHMPTAEDGDAIDCIFIWDKLNRLLIVKRGNAQALARENVTHWARIPDGPRPKEKCL